MLLRQLLFKPQERAVLIPEDFSLSRRVPCSPDNSKVIDEVLETRYSPPPHNTAYYSSESLECIWSVYISAWIEVPVHVLFIAIHLHAHSTHKVPHGQGANTTRQY